MRRPFVRAALCCLGLLCSGALADEYGEHLQPPVDVAQQLSPFGWTGFYAGGNFGFSYSDTRFAYAATALAPCVAVTGSVGDCQTTGNANSNGLAGGLQAGFNHQLGELIWGVEGDAAWLSEVGKATFLPGFGGVQNFGESRDWLITLRPRLGFAYYRAFLYATGGVAWSGVSHTVSFQDPSNVLSPLTVHESGVRAGWTLGTGVEYALSDHVTFKGEYLFVDFGEATVTTPAVGGWFATTTRFSQEEHVLRVGLNYRF